MDRSSIWCLDLLHGGKIMPKGKGTYGSRVGRPKKKKKGGKKKKKGMRHHGC